MNNIIRIEGELSVPTYVKEVHISDSCWYLSSSSKEAAAVYTDIDTLALAYKVVNKYIKDHHKTYQLFIENYEVA